MLAWSRLLVLIPVVFLMLDAAGSFIYGADIFLRSTTGLIGEPKQIGGRLGQFIIVMDAFLVGVTLMIASFGMYELFVRRTEPPGGRHWLPGWLRMRDLEDLKARVVSMLILVVAITFTDIAVESHDEQGILFIGLGISVVIAALTVYLRYGRRAGGETKAADTQPRGPRGMPVAAADQAAPTQAPPAQIPPARGPAGWPEREASVPATRTGSGRARRSPAANGASRRSRARVLALAGTSWRHGVWNLAARTTVLAVAGRARLDLTDAIFPDGTPVIRIFSLLGIVSVIVPPDVQVRDSGLTLLGSGSVGPAPRPTAGSEPRRLIISGASVLAMVRVRTRADRAQDA